MLQRRVPAMVYVGRSILLRHGVKTSVAKHTESYSRGRTPHVWSPSDELRRCTLQPILMLSQKLQYRAQLMHAGTISLRQVLTWGFHENVERVQSFSDERLSDKISRTEIHARIESEKGVWRFKRHGEATECEGGGDPSSASA